VHARYFDWVSLDVGVELTPFTQSEFIRNTALLTRHIDLTAGLHHQMVSAAKEVLPENPALLS
jgi:hypothetical protein